MSMPSVPYKSPSHDADSTLTLQSQTPESSLHSEPDNSSNTLDTQPDQLNESTDNKQQETEPSRRSSRARKQLVYNICNACELRNIDAGNLF